MRTRQRLYALTAESRWEHEYLRLEARLRSTRWRRFCAAVLRLPALVRHAIKMAPAFEQDKERA